LLYEQLCAEHGYGGSYKSVLRYVRRHYAPPKLRPYRRVETPPGAQVQVDWGTVTGIELGGGPETLYAFVAVLSHSRKETVIWRRRMDQLSWHHAHNEAWRRLGGVPVVVRLDNLKTAIVRGAGPWSEINAAYLAYDVGRDQIDTAIVSCNGDMWRASTAPTEPAAPAARGAASDLVADFFLAGPRSAAAARCRSNAKKR
jgi:hypothetical protein